MEFKHDILAPSVLKRVLIAAITASLAGMNLSVRAEAPQYRLLLGIVVEGLDENCLEQLRDRLGDGGFRMLADKGVYLPFADYGTSLDATAATATLVTGAHPALTGIDSELRYDREKMLYSHVFADPQALGNFTNDTYSPKALRVSTISDEARIAGSGISVVYAVASTPGQALALGGHSANSALWIDPATANWASTAFYRDMPTGIATRNRREPLTARMDTMSWAPKGGPELYSMLPEHLTRYPFRYVFQRSNPKRMEMFLQSPLANREVTAVAGELLKNNHIGAHEEGIDVLNIGYTLTPYAYGRNADKRPEQYDAYLRLDDDLEQLFQTVDRTVGLDHTLIYLAGTPARPYSARDDEKWNIPYGEFSTRRAASLLNIYLMALHGNGDYVSAFRGGKVYLNNRELKDKGLDGAQVRSEAAQFLARMTGVDRVYTSDAIYAGTAGENADALRRNTVVSTAPDVTLTVAPGYEIIDDFAGMQTQAEGAPHYVRRAVATTAPVFIYSPELEARRIDTPVDVRRIAPTVTRLLRIRSPNGAVEASLRLNRLSD